MVHEVSSSHLGVEEGLSDVSIASSAAYAIALTAQQAGVARETVHTVQAGAEATKGIFAVGKTVLGTGAAVTSAAGLTVAATSGAGITSGLAAAGGIVGGGMAMGPAVIAAGPAYLGSRGIIQAFFKDGEGLCEQERSARKAARIGTNVGAAAGLAGVGATTIAGGASGAAIMSTLASVGGAVGGGAIAGTLMLAVLPVATAAGLGYWIYKKFGGCRYRGEQSSASHWGESLHRVRVSRPPVSSVGPLRPREHSTNEPDAGNCTSGIAPGASGNRRTYG